MLKRVRNERRQEGKGKGTMENETIKKSKRALCMFFQKEERSAGPAIVSLLSQRAEERE